MSDLTRTNRLRAYAADMWPNQSQAWRDVHVQRVEWYADHHGDMTGAPEYPEDA